MQLFRCQFRLIFYQNVSTQWRRIRIKWKIITLYSILRYFLLLFFSVTVWCYRILYVSLFHLQCSSLQWNNYPLWSYRIRIKEIMERTNIIEIFNITLYHVGLIVCSSHKLRATMKLDQYLLYSKSVQVKVNITLQYINAHNGHYSQQENSITNKKSHFSIQ